MGVMNLPPTPPQPNRGVLDEALSIAEPLVLWMLRSGVGYAEFTQALKPVFLAQARLELERNGQRDSDSAVSLLSGLHRKDVRAFREASHVAMARVKEDGSSWGKPSAANQVVTRWLSLNDMGDCIPFSGEAPSFEALARAVSTDFHPRAVLQDMQRLGVFADGLSAESVQELNLMANALWAHVLQAVMARAVPLCERDVNHPQPQRFRLGLFTFAAPEFKSEDTGVNQS